ncbi:serine/threonine dehydratase [Litorimonas cladophorae]|uniref:Serine/threonine dehydratase n=1 Tax=Litorimonas cladophorae TaxID=1220491 RepID=A0A918NAT1_9PROT|nr:threonine/serine dehydratase [Litorimonas cladophorae]GGX59057.1 serine/threonine dehydratase [Litorimonas cladophorae]
MIANMSEVPTFQDVVDAVVRLDGHAVKTPLLRSDTLDKMTGKKLWFKAECLQKKNAFKYRGAFNRLSALTETERAKGVVAFSSGNHAQGVSCAAKELGIDAIIVMPTDAPKVKVAGVLADGATIITYDRLSESREDIAADIAARDGRIIVPSYDDAFVIAGQGTIGVELAEAEPRFDAMITCLGGGGMCAGISLALKALSPQTKIFGAEPTAYNDHQQSLRSGQRAKLSETPPTLCDAIMTPMPGEITWAINGQSLSDVFTVSDEECLNAMRLAHEHLGVVLEPGGAAAIAATLGGNFPDEVTTIAVVLSGGNVDPQLWERAINGS